MRGRMRTARTANDLVSCAEKGAAGGGGGGNRRRRAIDREPCIKSWLHDDERTNELSASGDDTPHPPWAMGRADVILLSLRGPFGRRLVPAPRDFKW